jgi:hypothetical protein
VRQAQPTAAVPADVQANLRRDYGITVATPEPGTRSHVRAGRAMRIASDYGFGGAAASAHLVRYTDPVDCELEDEMDAGQIETARCTPVAVDRLAWLVVFRDARAPIFGPPGRRGPDTYEATIAAFVDGRTGAELGAVTLPPG